jgi:hypothetical protein
VAKTAGDKDWNMMRCLAIGACTLMAACATVPERDCTQIYTLGDAGIADALASGRQVMKPGPLPARAVPPSAPRTTLESDGSYAGGRVYCSLPEAKSALARIGANKKALPDRGLRVYEVAAQWRQDVYELRPDDYRLKRSVQMLRAID